MDAVKFIKEINRLCEAQEDCKDCPLIGHACDVNTATIISCYNIESVQEMVQIVEQWAKEHPKVTRKREFLKMFPNAEMVNIERTFCVAHFEPTKKCKGINPSEEQCIACRYRFWNEEVTDND